MICAVENLRLLLLSLLKKNQIVSDTMQQLS